MSGEIPSVDHPLQRWIDSTFGDYVPGLPGSARTVLQEQIFIVLQVAIGPAGIALPVLDRLARAAALIVTTTRVDLQGAQLRDLFSMVPLPADGLSYILQVITRLPPESPDDINAAGS